MVCCCTMLICCFCCTNTKPDVFVWFRILGGLQWMRCLGRNYVSTIMSLAWSLHYCMEAEHTTEPEQEAAVDEMMEHDSILLLDAGKCIDNCHNHIEILEVCSHVLHKPHMCNNCKLELPDYQP